jgi:hypothetical protein
MCAVLRVSKKRACSVQVDARTAPHKLQMFIGHGSMMHNRRCRPREQRTAPRRSASENPSTQEYPEFVLHMGGPTEDDRLTARIRKKGG